MSGYSMLVAAHIAFGAVALVSFWLAAFLRKGCVAHRAMGQVYLLMMVGILSSGALMAYLRFTEGFVVAGVFLGFLAVFTANSTWRMWRAIKDKSDVARYTGWVFQLSAGLVLLYGLGALALGIRDASLVMVGVSAIGVYAGAMLLRQSFRRVALAAQPRWWIKEHYSAMLANGIATHVAFLTLGLPRLLPAFDGKVLGHVAWFGPILVAVLIKRGLDRRWKRSSAGARTQAKIA